MYGDNNGITIIWFLPISQLKKPLERIFFSSIFWFQEMSLKGEIFVNLLPQKVMTKYGIGSTYSVTFVSQKNLACLQCNLPPEMELGTQHRSG